MVNDGDLVVAAGTPEGWGVGVIAGTGSIAVGRAKDGRTARAGGWGHLIGDEGSAYGVVLDALRLVARRADGRDPRPSGRDPLTERLCAALGVAEASQIVTTIYSPEFIAHRIASLAPEVLAACAEAPETGEQLLIPAGAALAETVAAVARSLGWTSGVLPLAVAGGFLLSADDRATRDDRRPDPTRLPGGRDTRRRPRPGCGHSRRVRAGLSLDFVRRQHPRMSYLTTSILVAAVVITGQDRTPPRRRARSDWTSQLRREDPAALARDARRLGDARRGALVFYQPALMCTKCHRYRGHRHARATRT